MTQTRFVMCRQSTCGMLRASTLLSFPGRGPWRKLMAKALMWIVIVIFLIGLLVVVGVFDLIF